MACFMSNENGEERGREGERKGKREEGKEGKEVSVLTISR